jgi:acyl-CoA synthetase (AMP-forming)/AMP-acid ligase II
MGFKQGDVLGILLPNVLEYPIVMYGASGIGMPVTLINPIYTVGNEKRLTVEIIITKKRFGFI